MPALTLAAILQIFLIAAVVTNGGRRLGPGAYLPIGIAVMGMTLAAVTLATPLSGAF